jgi:hypothetical protein
MMLAYAERKDCAERESWVQTFSKRWPDLSGWTAKRRQIARQNRLLQFDRFAGFEA